MEEPVKISWYDKTRVVVIDVGYKYTKVGISGEANPRFIVPSKLPTGTASSILEHTDARTLHDNIASFLHFIYFKRLLINPKETKVVVVESILGPSIIRKTIAKVLFSHLEVMAVIFVPSHMVALYTLATSNAISIDLGYTETCAVPVYQGYPVLYAYQAAPIGSKAIEEEIRRLLIAYYSEKNPSKVPLIYSLPDQIIEDIKVALCFVAPMEMAYRADKDTGRPPDVSFPIPGGASLLIPGSVREDACEVLFAPDIDGVCLPTLVLDAILKCPLDMRIPLSDNLLLFGGTAMLKGLRSRLTKEILQIAQSKEYKEKISINSVKMFLPPSKDNFTAWLGGSLLGATDTVSARAVSKEEYNNTQDIPDWANFKYNVKKEAAAAVTQSVWGAGAGMVWRNL